LSAQSWKKSQRSSVEMHPEPSVHATSPSSHASRAPAHRQAPLLQIQPQPISTRYPRYTHTSHTHTFTGPFSGTTQLSRHQKGKTSLDFSEASDSEWQWHQLGHMQVCTLLVQTDNHANTPPLSGSVFTGRMPFLPPNQ